jgi:hypothetical protein
MGIVDNSHPYFDNVYTMETMILNFIPSATIEYDDDGTVIINTHLHTDEDGNLISFNNDNQLSFDFE